MPTSTAATRQPRLKETCDRCSIAKVRCSRDTHCTRCVSKGLPCVYSLSRRAGRRHGPKKSDSARVDRLASSSPPPTETDSSPVSPEQEMDALYSWDFPLHSSGDLNSTISTQLTLNNDLYDLDSTLLQQPLNYYTPMTNAYSTMISPHTIVPPNCPTSFTTTAIPAEAPAAPLMHRSPTSDSELSVGSGSSISSSQVDSVHDELTSLAEFAERMEQKFDTVVRQRLQYRNMCSEFGVPDELETPILDDSGDFGMAQTGKKGPDLAEMGFYYSLAELKRRLKWLREDVGNMMQPGIEC